MNREEHSEESVNVRLLQQGFEAFKQATLKLQAYYHGLEEKVDELNHELAQKNKELELNLQERERVRNYLTNIFESSAIGFIVTDLDGIITSVNQIGLRLIGEPLKELQGTRLNDVFKSAILPWNPTLADLKFYENAKEQELEFQDPGGKKLRLLLSLSLMYSEFGDILGLIVNVQDISELKKLEAQAERKNRFTVMGEMGATLAHEIRNPLGSIELFSSLLKKEMDPESSQQQLIGHISSAIQSMNHVISNILEYTKPQTSTRGEIIGVHGLLNEILGLTLHLVDDHYVRVQTDFQANTTRIRGDNELLKQVFRNLLANAAQSILEEGVVTIKTRNIRTNNEKILKRFRGFLGEKENLHLIEISIQDTGIGMLPEVKKKIFDPFFTTKERGTGLGLAIVHNIIEAHGAVIDVESEIDQGTQMTLLFPVMEEITSYEIENGT
ncbi:MAG: PAS domain S-box protein [SAR324 cluster bacterium]|nr:PAS domain S-box protein [SAR324 cluster bacterium]